jgi:RNA polymerase sigma-70 factor (family 1)
LDLIQTDIELIKLLQLDSTEAFDLLYKKYSGKLYAFGLKYLKSVSEAEELVQLVFLKVWENRLKLKKELSFKSYLFTIAYNDICKFFRKRNYQKQFIENTILENKTQSISSENAFDLQSFLVRVEEIIETLPERQRIIIRKSKFNGMTTKEIAQELKLAPGTIDNYISEALKFIRSKIGNEDLLIILFFSLFIF